ncbi:type I restriction endonuclease subunit R [Rubritalea profundi]|uniref:Type I restriction enzyme endonuclease subunit n=1 Tax=Rubritalea profundi TaxID=1658618 RepID=A0A2S7TXG7_9BACT|nr:type I restriction endonuclease subunit R [Rubritalea profundi]PQJ27446.1 deoxyribonuclease HsdR [Rubritalea profundi]
MTQSEQTLENELVDQLVGLGYERVKVEDEASLLANLKTQLEAFNGVALTDTEFGKVMNHLTRSNAVFEKAKILRDKMALEREDGETVYLDFLDENQLERNLFQVTQQVTMEGSYKNRYDVTVLVNGLPLLQIELKRRGLELKEAFNQTNRYQRHSYWAGSGLFNFIQLFVITNGVNTKYYANSKGKQSFKQTFYWAKEDNQTIRELTAFTDAFLNRQHLAKMLSQYIVRNEANKILMVLRPYQFYATEKIVDRVLNPPESNGNGYIWHTTGSGKTLTSFKASQILTGHTDVHKVVFCVDRKDLDYQTITEFNSFSKGSVDSTDNTAKLVEQFTDDTKLIVTTIQKLNTAISKAQHLNKMEQLRDKKIIFIFDECHRSQFGDTHQRIVDFFRNQQMFGFTGTPIFAENAASKNGKKRTTKDLFHKKLHSYVITDAIKDENVLKFSVEYVGRYKQKADSPNNVDIEVEGIDTKELMESPARLEKITDYILDRHKAKTKHPQFNAMFCVSSVDVLIQYYQLFARKKKEGKHNLKIATIFSYAANEDDKDADGILDEGGEIVGGDVGNKHTREHLDSFISEYNGMFGTNYSTKDSKSFYGYYQDIAKKVKAKQVDILLVVNMFLTGFDAKTLNTLYVDKNLRYHGLIQAYSRTNRILNQVKSQGNIVVFRNLKGRTDEALKLFSNVDAKEEIFIPPYDKYVELFNEVVNDLTAQCETADDVKDLPDEEAELKFIKTFRELMRLMNILESYAEFDQNELGIDAQDYADFKSAYLDLYNKVKTDTEKEKVSILDDVDFELELIHRDVINVQYILQLLAQLYDADDAEQKAIKKRILDALAGDPELRTKKELIEKFIETTLPTITNAAEIPECFEEYWEQERRKAFEELVKEEQLNEDKLKKVIDRYIYTGKEPLSNPDIIQLIERKLKLSERKPTRERVLSRVIDYVSTFIKGVAA